MNYNVEVTDTAQRDAYEAYTRIAAESLLNALRWFELLSEAMQTLDTFPQRCSVASESELTEEEVRHLLFGNYRILFVIRERTVYILHVRHGARQTMSPDEIELL